MLETVVPGETDILVEPDPDVAAIIEAVEALTPARAEAMRGACERQAKMFGKAVFFEKMEQQLEG